VNATTLRTMRLRIEAKRAQIAGLRDAARISRAGGLTDDANAFDRLADLGQLEVDDREAYLTRWGAGAPNGLLAEASSSHSKTVRPVARAGESCR